MRYNGFKKLQQALPGNMNFNIAPKSLDGGKNPTECIPIIQSACLRS